MEKYIKQLLSDDSRAIIPQFGCVMALREDDKVQLSFNPYLNFDDGKLTAAIMAGEGISEEDAQRRVSDIVDSYNNDLSDGKAVTLAGIGTFSRDSMGRTDFTQVDDIDDAEAQSTEEATAEAIVAEQAATASTEPEPLPEPEPQPEPESTTPGADLSSPTPDNNDESRGGKKPLIVLLIILLLLLIAGVVLYFHKDNAFYKYFFAEKQSVETPAPAPEPKPEPADTVKQVPAPAPEPPKTTKTDPLVAKPLTKRYNVIVGSYRDEQTAIKRVEELGSKGFDGAFVGIRKDHFVAVIADFSNITEAEKMQEQIVEGQYHIESWITNSGE